MERGLKVEAAFTSHHTSGFGEHKDQVMTGKGSREEPNSGERPSDKAAGSSGQQTHTSTVRVTRSVERVFERSVETFELHHATDHAHSPRPDALDCNGPQKGGVAQRSLRDRLFVFCASVTDHGFMVLLAALVPLVVLWVAKAVGIVSDPAIFAFEFYSVAFLIAVALFGELRIDSRGKGTGPFLHFYHGLLHWLAPIAMVAFVLAMIVIEFAAQSPVGLVLSHQPNLAIFFAGILYFTYKVPTLWQNSGVIDDSKDEGRARAEKS
jgi:hypothetical protein